MTTPSTNANPSIPSDQVSGYDDTGHQSNVLARMVNVATDATTGEIYGDIEVAATVSPPASVVSTVNSSTTPLAGNATFTGTSESILPYGAISVQVFTDQASAASGLIIEQSQDGTNWDTQTASSVSASTNFQKTVNATGHFYRVVYTNGSTLQGTFRLQTIKEVAASPAAGVANQTVNITQANGTTLDTNSGPKSAGTVRVVLATDQPALTNKLLVTPDSVALPANQSVNVNQFGGQSPTLDNTTIQAVSMRGKGTVAGDTSPLIDTVFGGLSIEQFIQYHILQGHGFRATTTQLFTNGTNCYIGMQASVNNIAKNVLFYNVIVGVGSGTNSGDAQLRTGTSATTDTALTTSLTARNQQPASGTTSLLTSLVGSPASTTQTGTFSGTEVIQMPVPTDAAINLLLAPSLVYFKATDVGTIAAYVRVATSANGAAVSMEWIEF